MNDMNCEICGADILGVNKVSVSLVTWDPEIKTNELNTIACSVEHVMEIVKRERR
jgi:hypothetical protein